MQVDKLNESLEVLINDLGDGLLSCDIWISGTGQPVASHNGGNPKATALFDQITENIQKALEISGFEKLSPYYLFNVEGGVTVIVVLVDSIQAGMAINPEKIPLGLLLNIAVPNFIEAIKKAF